MIGKAIKENPIKGLLRTTRKGETGKLEKGPSRLDVFWEAALWLVVASGVGMRIFLYSGRRSLWLDEAALASGIADASILDLPLTGLGGQSAPLGFVILTKLSMSVLGPGELALRLIPLISGIAILVVAKFLAARVVSSRLSQLFIVLAFSLSPLLSYYAQEFKQYSSDALASMVIIAMWLALQPKHGKRPIKLLGVLGFMLAILSLTAAVGLFAIFLTLALSLTRSRFASNSNLPLGEIAKISAWWFAGIGFQLGYQIVALGASRSELRDFWQQAGAYPPSMASGLQESSQWYIDLVQNFLAFGFIGVGRSWGPPISLLIFFLLLLLFFLGLKENLALGTFLVLPVALAIVLAEAGLYPFHSRLTIYLLPFVFILLGLGVEKILRSKNVVRPLAISFALTPLLVAGITSYNQALTNSERNDFRAIYKNSVAMDPNVTLITNGTSLAVADYYRTQGLVGGANAARSIHIFTEVTLEESPKPPPLLLFATHRQSEIKEYAENQVSEGGYIKVCQAEKNGGLLIRLVPVDSAELISSESCRF